jgi:hypothetical protein
VVLLGGKKIGHFVPLSRRGKSAIMIISLVVLLTIVPYFIIFRPDSSAMSWFVEVDDSFTSNVTVYSTYGTDNGWELDELMDYDEWVAVQNSTLVLKVTSLPEIPNPLTVESFLDEIVGAWKLSVSYSNSTSVPSEVASDIVDDVSAAFLPIGGWSNIDLFFADVGPTERSTSKDVQEYHSRFIDDSTFLFEFIQFRMYQPKGGAGSGFRAYIDVTTGIPRSVGIWKNYLSPSLTFSAKYMNLTLVSI